MEKASTSEQLKRIRSELVHGRDLARQLHTHIKNDSSSSRESIRLFIDGLVKSCSLSVSMLTSVQLPNHLPFPTMPPESRSRTRSAGDNQDAECLVDAQSCSNKSGKRKCVKRVTHVTLAEGAGLEAALEDGYSWRKYGQKDILGSRYPRGYYRCTHKTTQGCFARKQIQRIDEQGPPVFKIIFVGTHTCSHHQQPCNSHISSHEPPPSIHRHDAPFPDQHHHHQESYILLHPGPILPSNINPHSNYTNKLFLDHMSFDIVGYQPSLAPSTTCFADHFNHGHYQAGVSDVPSVITSTVGSPTRRLHQQIEFDPVSDIVNWDFDLYLNN